jgi:O-antigen ligase
LLLAGGLALIASMGYRETVTSLGTLVGGGSDLSVGRRIVLWDAGLSQAWESPWTGFGPDSVREKILSIKPLGSLGYSHYQNFVINSLIRGGIFELLALLAIPASIIWFARKPSLTEAERAGKAILLSVCSTFYLTGLVGILFTHDIMNAVFVYTVIIGLCSAEPSAVTAAGPAIARNASEV